MRIRTQSAGQPLTFLQIRDAGRAALRFKYWGGMHVKTGRTRSSPIDFEAPATKTMKPSKSILDESFTYVPSTITAVEATWRRFGWQPSTGKERRIRRLVPGAGDEKPAVGSKVTAAS